MLLKKRKTITVMLLGLSLVCIALCLISLSGCGYSNDYEIEYDIVGNGVDAYYVKRITTKGNKCDVVIPSTHKNLPVIGIEGTSSEADKGKIYRLTIPASIEWIKDYAVFNQYNLESVAFEKNSNLKTIGRYAFKITKSASLFRRKKTYSINLEDTKVEDIGAGAFYCESNSCNRPEKIYLPKTVKQIGVEAFGSGIEELYVEDSDAFFNAKFDYTSDYALYSPMRNYSTALGRFIKRIYQGTTLVTSVEFNQNKTEIEPELFMYLKDITSVKIPEGVTSIGQGAFSESNITSIELPSTLDSLGMTAFYKCKNLKRVTILSLENIQYDTFCGCPLLSTIELPSNLKTIGQGAFNGCFSLKTLELPSQVRSLGDWAFQNCEKLSAIELPQSLSDIGSYAFLGCKKLAEIRIPASVSKIGEKAFSGSGLTKATFENSVGWSAKGALSVDKISNAQDAAFALTTSYVDYAWKRN